MGHAPPIGEGLLKYLLSPRPLGERPGDSVRSRTIQLLTFRLQIDLPGGRELL